VFLHYLVKIENYKIANFSNIFASCETSEFVLPDTWPSDSLGPNLKDYKVWETMQQ